jgi:hypothetical protein
MGTGYFLEVEIDVMMRDVSQERDLQVLVGVGFY